MMRRLMISALLVTPLVAAAPIEVCAGPPPVAASQGDAEADALFHQGSTAFDAGKLDKAYELFTAAWKLKRTHDIAGNLAQVEIALGKKRDAAEHIAFALATFPPSLRNDRPEKMRKALDALRKEVAVLRIHVNVADAKIVIDGTPIGDAPLAKETFVEPGAHVIGATQAGYKAAQVRVDAAKGSAQDVSLTLDVAAPEPPTVPPIGNHAGPAGPSKPVIITGAVVGGAGVILGAVFAGLSNARANEAETKQQEILKLGVSAGCGTIASPRCQALQAAMREQATFGNAAAWSFIAAGGVGVGTVVYALVAPRGEKKSGMRVVPLIAADGGGAVLQGKW